MVNKPYSYINEDEYYKSAILFSCFLKNGEYYLVLEQRSNNISQAGEICFPGGRFDHNLDKTTKDTAIRETHEELGIDKRSIKNVSYWGRYIAPMYTLIDVYIGLLDIDSIDKLNINKYEVEKLIVLPYSYFLNTSPRSYKIDTWSYPYRKKLNKDDKVIDIFPAKKLGLPQKYHKPWRGKSRKIYLYPDVDVPIWGVTANIIKKFTDNNPSLSEFFTNN